MGPVMVPMASKHSLAGLEKLDLQAQEDQWWDSSEQYQTYSELPASSKWNTKLQSGTTPIIVLSVDGKDLTFPRCWLSIFFLLDIQQLSCMAEAISSTKIYSKRLYSNVAFIHQLRVHIIQARLEVKDMAYDWTMPPHLERWMQRLLHGLSSEKGAYSALKEDFHKAYQSGTVVWELGNHLLFQLLFSN